MRIKEFFGQPLEPFLLKTATTSERILPAITIAIFTLFSLGGYAIFAHSYFKNRKVEIIRDDINREIEGGQLQRVREVFNRIKPNEKLYLDQAILTAARKGKFEMVKYLIEEQHADVDAHTRVDKTPLIYAIEADELNYELINYLIEQGGRGLMDPLFHSPLAAMAKHLNNPNADLQQTKNTLELMLSREAKLLSFDQGHLDLSAEARNFFEEYEATHDVRIL